MPTYEYECQQCNKQFEVFQSMKDEPIKVCPDCGSEVKRLIHGGAGIIYKGSGFYNTDKSRAAPGSAKKSATPEGTAPCAAKDSGGACSNCPAAKAEGAAQH